MTYYGAIVVGGPAGIAEMDNWVGEPMDGFLAYTQGWDSNNWGNLRPFVAYEPSDSIGYTRRRIFWSIMMIPDPNSAEQARDWYREVASGARNSLYDQMGRDLMLYASMSNETGPIYVRSTWEVPGEWFYWNQGAVLDPEAFKGAWRQFATSLRAGRPQIKTVFDFNSDRGPIEYLYPGDEYVDVIGQDIYWIHDLQGRDPVAAFNHSRHGYVRGLQWNLDWCRQKGKPLAISEYGIKLTDGGEGLDYTRWFQEFFAFVDECNAPGNPGMAYVSWWDSDHANVGKFTGRVGEPHESNVKAMFRARLPGSAVGTVPPIEPPPPPNPDPTYPPVTATYGTGADSLVLKINQDVYQGSAQYTVRVDGVQIGPTITASALRSTGQTDTITLLGSFSAGSHAVRVDFLNDLYAGTAATDRNVYIDSASFNSVVIASARQEILGSNNPGTFSFTKTGVVEPPPPTPVSAAAPARALSTSASFRAVLPGGAASVSLPSIVLNASAAFPAVPATVPAVPPPTPTPEPTPTAPGLTIFSRTRTPLVSGRRLLTRAPGNLAAPAIVIPPSGLLFDYASAEGGQKLLWPMSNNQFDALGFGGSDGTPRNWERTLNNPLHRLGGVRYYYAWMNILMGAFPQWQPAWRRVFRVYRKGASGQALRTLVFECEFNTATVPVGDTVWFCMDGTDYEGQILPNSSWDMEGFSFPLKQKMIVTGGAGSTDGRSTVEVTFGQDMPNMNWTAPTWRPQSWSGDEPRLWLIHHSFYANAATKTLRYPYNWHFDILKQEVVGNGGHVVLGGFQGIPTWRDWTGLANMVDFSLIMELYRKEQEALADQFGDTDPRFIANELENEPVESWQDTPGRIGFRNSLLNYMYPIARQAWGQGRSFIVKGSGFGGTDTLRDTWDIDNDTVWGGAPNFLCSHNYYGQAKRANGSQIWWGDRADCDEMVGWIVDKISTYKFKGGGMTECSADKWHFGNPNEGPYAEQEQGRMVGRMETALHAAGLFVCLWSLVGDGAATNWLYNDVPGAEGHWVEAVAPNQRPFMGKAGRTV